MTTLVPIWLGVLIGIGIGGSIATVGYIAFMLYIASRPGATSEKVGE